MPSFAKKKAEREEVPSVPVPSVPAASRQSQAAGPISGRVHARHDDELEVSLESESNFYMGLTESLSEGGRFIATHVIRPIGTEGEVSFKLPHVAEAIKAVGIVRWTREYSESSDTSPGMGVRF